MKTIKTTTNGKTTYKKPKGYKPQRKNRSNWYLADKKTPTCQQIYEIGMAYYTRMQNKEGRPRHRIKHTAQLVKLFYWIYLSGVQPGETFRQPLSLQIVREQNRDYMHIKHSNNHHKQEILMAMPILDQAEKQMWDFITDYGEKSEIEHIFQFSQWKSIAGNNISALFTKNFTANLENPMDNKTYKAQGIPPQILRYQRFKNLLIEHNAPDRVLTTWFGCNMSQLRAKHPELNRALDLKEQKIMLERNNLMPNIRLGLGAMPTY